MPVSPGNGVRVPVSASTLLSLPVRVDDILVGHVVDLILDAQLARALGLEVRCGDGEHRFLPFAAARISADGVDTRTPLALLDGPELAFYAARGARFRTMRGEQARGLGGPLADVELDEAGEVSRLVLDGPDAAR